MILRRLTKHVKDQNWFAVGLVSVIAVPTAFQHTRRRQEQGRTDDRAD